MTEMQWFRHDERAMAYWRMGEPAEVTFVLVHGIGMGHLVFAETAEFLARHGEVVLVDMPGFGESPEPEKATSISETGKLLAALVAELQLPGVVLVGHSMGTQVVAETMRRRPDVVAAGVLISPTVNPKRRSAWQQAGLLMVDLADESPRVLWLGLRYYLQAGPRWMIGKLRMMLQHRMAGVLPHVPQPTLVVRGRRDRVCSQRWCRLVADLLPQGRFSEVHGCGHEAMLRRPEAIARLILVHAGANA